MDRTIDPLDARLLDIIQADFPLVPRPFDEIGRTLGIAPNDVLARLTRLKSEGIIRQISAIFDSAALGYRSTLVAFRVEPRSLDAVAESVAAHKGVSHCYSRDADYNLWFTLTLGPDADLQSEVERLAGRPGVKSYMLLPALRVFKIGVFLRMTEDHEAPTARSGSTGAPADLTDDDRAAVRALQQDIPLVNEPFVPLAAEAGMTQDELLRRAWVYKERGIMRRFAAVLRHRRAGYSANAMVCWLVEPGRIEDVGTKLAVEPSVSHCYERPTSSDWPYALYTMVHCRTEAELDQTMERLRRIASGAPHLALRTVREYKKSRVSYF